jgi:hypothetical protein
MNTCVRPYSSAHTGRTHRTVDSAFRGADYGQAFWPHERPQINLWDAVLYWAAILLCVLAFALLSACGHSDPEVDADTAASVQDAITQARADYIAAHRQARAEFFFIATKDQQ